MSLMRKKPVPVEARGPIVEPEMVTTAHGRVRAEAGDYVLRDPKTGDTWPIKPDIFAATYEPVTEDRRAPSPSREDDHETFCKAADERATAAETALAKLTASREAEQTVLQMAVRWEADYSNYDEASHPELNRMELAKAVKAYIKTLTAPAQKPEEK
jgi:hypothetical protein